MTIISGSGKPGDHHLEVKRPTAEVEPGQRATVYWLICLATIPFLLVGVLCLHESMTQRKATDQVDFVAEGAASQVPVTIDEAMQSVTGRH